MTPADLIAAATPLGVSLSEAAAKGLLHYEAAVRKGSEKANLFSPAALASFLDAHVLDALTFGRALVGRATPRTLLDIGSGGGVPALPLAIALPGTHVHALESIGKKCAFLREAASEAGVAARFTVHEGRAEDLARDPALRDAFDAVTARAVAELPTLCEYALPFARPGGLFVAWKSKRGADTEVPAAKAALAALSARLVDVLPSGLEGRETVLVRIEKTGPTPPAYPRKVGIPDRKPLR